MGALGNLERFLERLFERPASRLFGAHLQPVHLQRRIERAMETERATGVDRTYAPNVFRLSLHPGDLAELAPVAEELAAELADAALAFARAHHFALADRPRVELVEDDSVATGDVRVTTAYSGARGPSPAGARSTAPGPGPEPDVARRTGALPEEPPGPNGEAGVAPDTMVFEIPEIRVPRASLHVTAPNGATLRIDVQAATLTIGRSPDNDLHLDDRRLSRHHARIQVRRGVLVVQDLGSTNGTKVNGQRVDEVALGDGDRIELGDSSIVVEQHPPL